MHSYDFIKAVNDLVKTPGVHPETILTLGGAHHEIERLHAELEESKTNHARLQQNAKDAHREAINSAKRECEVRTGAVDAIADNARIPLRSGGLLVLRRNDAGSLAPDTVVVTGRQTRKAIATAVREANAVAHLLFEVAGGFEAHPNGTITWDDIPF